MARSERPSKKTSSFGKRSDAEKNFLNKKKSDDRYPSDRPKRSFSRDRDDKPKSFGGEKRSFGSRDDRSSDRPKRTFSRDGEKPSRFGKPADGEKRSFGKRDDSSSDRSKRFSKPFEKRNDRGESSDRPFRKSSSRPFGESRSFNQDSEKPRGFAKNPYQKRDEEGGPFEKRSGGFDSDKPKRFSKEVDDKSSFRKEPKSFSSDGPRKFSKPFEKRDDEKPIRKGGFDADSKPFERSSRPFDSSEERPKKFTRDQVVKKTEKGEERKSFVANKLASSEGQERPEYKVKPKSDSELIRLNRFMANSGVGSRREADEFIKMGLVTVNGVTVTEMGHKVKMTDDVRYEGKRLKAEKPVYILLNKPKGFITTTDDPQERNTVMNLVANAGKERIYPVGRLDRNTTGLLLLTNDGELADKLTHPSYKAKKIYKAELDKPITKADFQKIQGGVHLEEGKAIVDDLAIVSDDKKTIGIELHIGWNRIVRRIFESVGYDVVKLDRVVYAGLDKKELSRGQWRFLKPEEVVKLKHFGS
jgi:23S rRNA pseudouridine2605 synthase